MCELFALSSSLPTDVTLSIGEFARHGGETGPHADGWGLAYLDEGKEPRVFREAAPASADPWLQNLRQQRLRGRIVVSHIRKATQGARRLANTQPFFARRQGQWRLFAHNGDLRGAQSALSFDPALYAPGGDTDSEIAFATLLHRFEAAAIPEGDAAALLHLLTPFAAELRALGPANFVYTDGKLLVAHADRRTQADGQIRSPGLHLLRRRCPAETSAPLQTMGLELQPTGEQDVILFASVPLTDEDWRPLERGALLVVSDGTIVAE